jgi:hypothetical protein
VPHTNNTREVYSRCTTWPNALARYHKWAAIVPRFSKPEVRPPCRAHRERGAQLRSRQHDGRLGAGGVHPRNTRAARTSRLTECIHRSVEAYSTRRLSLGDADLRQQLQAIGNASAVTHVIVHRHAVAKPIGSAFRVATQPRQLSASAQRNADAISSGADAVPPGSMYTGPPIAGSSKSTNCRAPRCFRRVPRKG